MNTNSKDGVLPMGTTTRSMIWICAFSLSLAIASSSLAGGDVTIDWNNTLGNELAPFYLESAGLTLLSAGNVGTTGDGFAIRLAALQGGTNYLLATASIGDLATVFNSYPPPYDSNPSGLFEFSSSISSNVAAGAVGSPLAVFFFNATDPLSATKYGVVSNASITVPSPNWDTAPQATSFAIDLTSAGFMGDKTSGGVQNYGPGYYTIPEPSTVVLVLAGIGAVCFRRRRRW